MLYALLPKDLREDVSTADLVASIRDTLHLHRRAMQYLAGGSGGSTAGLEVLLVCEEGFEVGGEEGPYWDALVEAIVATGAEVDEIFNGVETGHAEEACPLVFLELGSC